MTTMIYYDLLWFTMIYYDLLWFTITTMIYYDLLWFTMIYYDLLLFTMIYYDLLWFTVIYCDLLWFTMIYYDLLWFTMIHYDLLWFTICLLWFTMTYYDLLWFMYTSIAHHEQSGHLLMALPCSLMRAHLSPARKQREQLNEELVKESRLRGDEWNLLDGMLKYCHSWSGQCQMEIGMK